MKQGWISLYRKVLDNDIIRFGNKFSRMEAWIWLLLNVNYEERKFPIGAEIYTCKKGQMVTSQKKLCKEFNWGNSRLRTFLKLLQKDKMIEVKSNSKLTQITLLNYRVMQDSKPETNRKQIATKSLPNTNNNSNKDNKEIKYFEDWWNLYDKKIGKDKAQNHWLRNVKAKMIDSIMNHTKKYVQEKEKKYRKDPIRYLTHRVWEDEIVIESNGAIIDVSVKKKEERIERDYQKQINKFKNIVPATDEERRKELGIK